jgi:hypothetical protein
MLFSQSSYSAVIAPCPIRICYPSKSCKYMLYITHIEPDRVISLHNDLHHSCTIQMSHVDLPPSPSIPLYAPYPITICFLSKSCKYLYSTSPILNSTESFHVMTDIFTHVVTKCSMLTPPTPFIPLSMLHIPSECVSSKSCEYIFYISILNPTESFPSMTEISSCTHQMSHVDLSSPSILLSMPIPSE